MDKNWLPLTKDVEQKVIGSAIEELTKGMLAVVPVVVILMLLFIPDGSSHWSWLTAWFCLGPIMLFVGIVHFVAPRQRQDPIKWLDCEKSSLEISELKSDMIVVGYILASDEGFTLPDSIELSDARLLTDFPTTLYPHQIGIFSRSTMLLSFHGLTPLGIRLKHALKLELGAAPERSAATGSRSAATERGAAPEPSAAPERGAARLFCSMGFDRCSTAWSSSSTRTLC